MAKEARRDLRRAIGEEALGLLESNAEELRRVDHQNRAAIGRAMMILGRDRDDDIKNPVLKRLDNHRDSITAITNSVEELALAFKSHLERELAINRSFWTRLRWLLLGPR